MKEETKNKIEDKLRKAEKEINSIIKENEPKTETISWIRRGKRNMYLLFNFTEKKGE